jgi:hypothetical protein
MLYCYIDLEYSGHSVALIAEKSSSICLDTPGTACVVAASNAARAPGLWQATPLQMQERKCDQTDAADVFALHQ